MGTYTYAKFKDYLKFRFGNADSFDAYYGVWVNSAYRQLCSRDMAGKRKLHIPELLTPIYSGTTTAGTAYVAQSSVSGNTVMSVWGVFDETNDRSLEWISIPSYYSKTDRDTTAARGKPEKWTRIGENAVYLYPTPDGAYSIRIYYRRLPPAMTLDAGVTIIGGEWDDVILELAHSVGRNWVGEPEKAEVSRKLADEMISNIMDVYLADEKNRTESLRPDPAYHSRGQGY
jgi:hypothetical protein